MSLQNKAVEAVFTAETGRIRAMVARAVKTRYVPALKFVCSRRREQEAELDRLFAAAQAADAQVEEVVRRKGD